MCTVHLLKKRPWLANVFSKKTKCTAITKNHIVINQTTYTWKQISLYLAIIFSFGKPTMAREDKVFAMGRHIYRDFFKKPAGCWSIVVMSDTQLLNLLQQMDDRKKLRDALRSSVREPNRSSLWESGRSSIRESPRTNCRSVCSTKERKTLRRDCSISVIIATLKHSLWERVCTCHKEKVGRCKTINCHELPS